MISIHLWLFLFIHRFLKRLGIDIGYNLEAFSNTFPDLFVIDFLYECPMVFSMDFGPARVQTRVPTLNILQLVSQGILFSYFHGPPLVGLNF